MKYFSTFSGIGGFELGIEQAYVDSTKRSENGGSEEDSQGKEGQGLVSEKGEGTNNEGGSISQHDRDIVNEGQPTCVGYSEIDKYAIEIYEKHFNHKNYGDITTINEKELPDFDLLVGGFPCQAFSIAGRRGGFEDTRGTLFFEIARIIREKQPRLFILENVRGLLSHDKGNTFNTIISTIDELGYDAEWQVINSKNHGVPQNRDRVFIVGHLRGEPRSQIFPFTRETRITCNEIGTITAIKGAEHSKRCYGTDGLHPTLATGSGGNTEKKILDTQISKTIRVGGGGSPHGSKQNWDSYEIEGQVRRLSPTECERLQGFPDGWTEGVSDTQRYKTLGNAVTVNVVRDIYNEILQTSRKDS